MPAERLYNKKPTAEFESMDVSGGESAPEPDMVMDCDEDFKPVESEDEAVTQNIEIARNLQKTQTDMVKQVGKTWREGKYQIGDWVSLDKEPRSGLSKMDAVRYGPFKVVGRCKKRPANYNLLYLAIPGSTSWRTLNTFEIGRAHV